MGLCCSYENKHQGGSRNTKGNTRQAWLILSCGSASNPSIPTCAVVDTFCFLWGCMKDDWTSRSGFGLRLRNQSSLNPRFVLRTIQALSSRGMAIPLKWRFDICREKISAPCDRYAEDYASSTGVRVQLVDPVLRVCEAAPSLSGK